MECLLIGQITWIDREFSKQNIFWSYYLIFFVLILANIWRGHGIVQTLKAQKVLFVQLRS